MEKECQSTTEAAEKQHQPWDCDGETIEEALSGAIHNGIQTQSMMGFNRIEEATHDHRDCQLCWIWLLAPKPADKHADNPSESTNLLIHETLVSAHADTSVFAFGACLEASCIGRDPQRIRLPFNPLYSRAI